VRVPDTLEPETNCWLTGDTIETPAVSDTAHAGVPIDQCAMLAMHSSFAFMQMLQSCNIRGRLGALQHAGVVLTSYAACPVIRE
jgi:hypothetical protein